MKHIPNGSVTSPKGFRSGAATCGLKDKGVMDVALILSDHECSGAGVFTRNEIVAAPVIVDRQMLTDDPTKLRGVVANAGIANACTGPKGLEACRRMQELAAVCAGCAPEQMLVLSTGVIGVQLDLDKIAVGIEHACRHLSANNGKDTARAIMTTDTHPKHTAVSVDLPGGKVTIGGIAKGSGMIHPNMATMLVVLTTDAAVPAEDLDGMLRAAVDRSFHHISIDGDTSTNDTVLILANGASGVTLNEGAAETDFEEALDAICVELAQAIVRDGEGASKFITLQVCGARSQDEALRLARTIATSPLVKTAFAGGDPNWGRILAAAGRANVSLDSGSLALWIASGKYDDLQLVDEGMPLDYDESLAEAIFKENEIRVRLDMGLGQADTTVWTCDLTHEYVSINADYRT
ncbi:MAG: bifunctional glutamate N-acetyltransferase/amino-acid acetyltransferase ArgJ [Anaerolineales bacterium]|jgi:glutamate N-acetyltransferase/amino-acid N-acetyltransferase